ncbi:MAG: hypothetical protein Q8P46_12600 [Hyphomicrobiales bacterium]|nr:hypothetical protein [Hyphomicrobiales bacterium]
MLSARDFTTLFGTDITSGAVLAVPATTLTRPAKTSATEPNGVVSMEHRHGSRLVHERANFVFWGAADGGTATYNIIGWNHLDDTGWVPYLLLTGALTVSTYAGVAGLAFDATDLAVDTVTATAGLLFSASKYTVYSPANNTPAVVSIDNALGSRIIQVQLKEGTATKINGAVQVYTEADGRI